VPSLAWRHGRAYVRPGRSCAHTAKALEIRASRPRLTISVRPSVRMPCRVRNRHSGRRAPSPRSGSARAPRGRRSPSDGASLLVLLRLRKVPEPPRFRPIVRACSRQPAWWCRPTRGFLLAMCRICSCPTYAFGDAACQASCREAAAFRDA
jgi:hypothetical protein